jgi:hypothetical protein
MKRIDLSSVHSTLIKYKERSGARCAAPTATGLVLIGALALSSCGGSSSSPTTTSVVGGHGATTSVTAAPETNTPGDIPDTIAYVTYTNSAGGYRFDHPEGWAQAEQGTSVTFTDRYNGVSASVVTAGAGPSVSSAQAVDVPALRASQPAFELRSVAGASLPAGSGVLIVYRRNSAPDPVTGRAARVEVERYEVYGSGHTVVLELFGAVGADNVDPYRRMSESLRLS